MNVTNAFFFTAVITLSNQPHQRNTQPELKLRLMPAFTHELFKKPVITEGTQVAKNKGSLDCEREKEPSL